MTNIPLTIKYEIILYSIFWLFYLITGYETKIVLSLITTEFT